MSSPADTYDEKLTDILATETGDTARPHLEDLIDEIKEDKEHQEELVSVFEKTLNALLKVYIDIGDGSKFSDVLIHLKPFFASIPKARTAKLVRIIIQALRKVPGTQDLQVQLCNEWIEWAKTEERTLLRQRLETELSEILLEQRRFQEALDILQRLSLELRKVDHKSQLIEVHLIESRTFRGLGDFSRAKAALTAARTNAAAVYTTPLLQGQLDLESGILFNDDGDYRTASSYFAEAFDAFSNAGDSRAIDALKYRLLCRILDGKANECQAIEAAAAISLQNSKVGGIQKNTEVEIMMKIAHASEEKSLHQLVEVINECQADIDSDPVISSNVKNLIDSLEEQHLLRIVKPYSAVELSRIAELIQLDVEQVESKLVQMILDQKLKASINQADGILNIFEDEEANELLTESIELIENMDGVVDALYSRCKLMN
jgi:26S proteasome regulatory subunit N6